MENLRRNIPPPLWIANHVANMVENTVTVGYGGNAIYLPLTYFVGHLHPPQRLRFNPITTHAVDICNDFYWNKYRMRWKS